MNPEVPRGRRLEEVRKRHHPRCFVGRSRAAAGLGVRFSPGEDGTVQQTVIGPRSWEGYPGLVHGGIIASLLDGAMTNSLFASGIAAVTAELKIRYHGPLAVERPMEIVGELVGSRPPLFLVEGRISQDGEIRARSSGKFMAGP